MYLYFLYPTVRTKCVDSYALSCNTQKNSFRLLYQYSQQPVSKVQDLFAFLCANIPLWTYIQSMDSEVICIHFLVHCVIFINMTYPSFHWFLCLHGWYPSFHWFPCLHAGLNFVLKIFFYFLFWICKTLHGSKVKIRSKVVQGGPTPSYPSTHCHSPSVVNICSSFWFILHTFSTKTSQMLTLYSFLCIS